MKNTIMIKKNFEFKLLFSKGTFYYGEYIHMYILVSNCKYNKLGIAVSTKQGKAVARNRIKRLIRENYKNFENNIKLGAKILIIINKKKNIEEISFKQIKKDFHRTLKIANIWVDEHD